MSEIAINIEDWSISNQDDNPYQDPTCKKHCLRGRVYGHPQVSDGEYILTSVIDRIDGRYVKIRNSTDIYRLGNIDPHFLEWLIGNGIEYDEREPIKI